jgi:hypothetical protein
VTVAQWVWRYQCNNHHRLVELLCASLLDSMCHFVCGYMGFIETFDATATPVGILLGPNLDRRLPNDKLYFRSLRSRYRGAWREFTRAAALARYIDTSSRYITFIIDSTGWACHPCPTTRLACAAVPSADDGDHAMTCSSVQGKATLRNDILKGNLCRAIHRAGVASTLEPTLHWKPGPIVLRGGQRRQAWTSC